MENKEEKEEKKEKKIPYEPPKAVRLGDTKEGHGDCGPGSSDSGNCVAGFLAAAVCETGAAASS